MNTVIGRPALERSLTSASLALGLLAACGGGDPDVPQSAAAEEATAIALVDSIRAHRASVVPFAHVLKDEFAEVPWVTGSDRCNGGGAVQVFLDGTTVGEMTELPGGSHTLAVSHHQCMHNGPFGGSEIHGSATAVYQRNEAEGSQHEITADVSSLAGVSVNGDFTGELGGVTAYGSGTFTRRQTSSEGYLATWAPAPGARLVYHVSNSVIAFNAGNYTLSHRRNSGSSETWSDVVIEFKGVRYVLSGALASGSRYTGEILITHDGLEVARVFRHNPSGSWRAAVKRPIPAL